MGFGDFMARLFGGRQTVCVDADAEESAQQAAFELYVRKMAWQICVQYLSSAMAKCRIVTYKNGKEVLGDEFYRWNVAPNRNQSGADFMRSLIERLHADGEALIVEKAGGFLLADGFERRTHPFTENAYEHVLVDGEDVYGHFSERDVLYFRLSEEAMAPLVQGFADAYASLIAYTVRAYRKSRGNKGVLEIDTIPGNSKEERDAYLRATNERFRRFFDAESAVMPLGRGMKYTDMTAQIKTYSSENTRDIRALIDDVLAVTARALGIPPVLVTGAAQDTKAATEQLMGTLDWLARLLENEINRKRYTKEEYLAGTYVHIDTAPARHIDPLSNAVAIDKLISSATFSVNDVLRLLGRPTVPEPWADKHFITKNYAELLGLNAT